MDVRLDVCVAL